MKSASKLATATQDKLVLYHETKRLKSRQGTTLNKPSKPGDSTLSLMKMANAIGTFKVASTPTKYAYLGDSLLATITGTGSTTASTTYSHADHLGSTRLVTDQSGAVIQSLDYTPYGAVSNDTASTTFSEAHQYIGQFADPESSLSYLNARYYEGSRGQFLSEDPAFWEVGQTDDGKAVLSNPQAMNSYSYAGNNPITNKDPNGRMFGFDDLGGIIGGGIVGGVVYAGESWATNESMTWGGASGAVVSGAIVGWGAVNTPETLGASDAIAVAALTGGAAGFAGNSTKQLIDVGTGAQKEFSGKDLVQSTAVGAVVGGVTEGVLPDAKVPGLSVGRDNMNAIGKGMQTKLTNGTITRVSASTGLKAAAGSQAAGAYKTLGGAVVDMARTLYTNNQSNQKPTKQGPIMFRY